MPVQEGALFRDSLVTKKTFHVVKSRPNHANFLQRQRHNDKQEEGKQYNTEWEEKKEKRL